MPTLELHSPDGKTLSVPYTGAPPSQDDIRDIIDTYEKSNAPAPSGNPLSTAATSLIGTNGGKLGCASTACTILTKAGIPFPMTPSAAGMEQAMPAHGFKRVPLSQAQVVFAGGTGPSGRHAMVHIGGGRTVEDPGGSRGNMIQYGQVPANDPTATGWAYTGTPGAPMASPDPVRAVHAPRQAFPAPAAPIAPMMPPAPQSTPSAPPSAKPGLALLPPPPTQANAAGTDVLRQEEERRRRAINADIIKYNASKTDDMDAAVLAQKMNDHAAWNVKNGFGNAPNYQQWVRALRQSGTQIDPAKGHADGAPQSYLQQIAQQSMSAPHPQGFLDALLHGSTALNNAIATGDAQVQQWADALPDPVIPGIGKVTNPVRLALGAGTAATGMLSDAEAATGPAAQSLRYRLFQQNPFDPNSQPPPEVSAAENDVTQHLGNIAGAAASPFLPFGVTELTNAMDAYSKGDKAKALRILQAAPGKVGQFAKEHKLEAAMLLVPGVLHGMRAAGRFADGGLGKSIGSADLNPTDLPADIGNQSPGAVRAGQARMPVPPLTMTGNPRRRQLSSVKPGSPQVRVRADGTPVTVIPHPVHPDRAIDGTFAPPAVVAPPEAAPHLTTPEHYMSGAAGVYHGWRGGLPGATGTDAIGGTFVAQSPEYASLFARPEHGEVLQPVSVTAHKPFVLQSGTNAEDLANAEAKAAGRPQSEADELAGQYRAKGLSYLSPAGKDWLHSQGYDALVSGKDLGPHDDSGPVMIGLDPNKVTFHDAPPETPPTPAEAPTPAVTPETPQNAPQSLPATETGSPAMAGNLNTAHIDAPAPVVGAMAQAAHDAAPIAPVSRTAVRQGADEANLRVSDLEGLEPGRTPDWADPRTFPTAVANLNVKAGADAAAAEAAYKADPSPENFAAATAANKDLQTTTQHNQAHANLAGGHLSDRNQQYTAFEGAMDSARAKAQALAQTPTMSVRTASPRTRSYGRTNTAVTTAERDAALAAIRNIRINTKLDAGASSMGGVGAISPVVESATAAAGEFLRHARVVGRYHYEQGLNTLKDWAKQMDKDVPGLTNAVKNQMFKALHSGVKFDDRGVPRNADGSVDPAGVAAIKPRAAAGQAVNPTDPSQIPFRTRGLVQPGDAHKITPDDLLHTVAGVQAEGFPGRVQAGVWDRAHAGHPYIGIHPDAPVLSDHHGVIAPDGGLHYSFTDGRDGKVGAASVTPSMASALNNLATREGGTLAVVAGDHGMSRGTTNFHRAYVAETEQNLSRGLLKKSDLDSIVQHIGQKIEQGSSKDGKPGLMNGTPPADWEDWKRLAPGLTMEARTQMYGGIGDAHISSTLGTPKYQEVLGGHNVYHDTPTGHVIGLQRVRPGQTKPQTSAQIGVPHHHSYPYPSEGYGVGEFQDSFPAHLLFHDALLDWALKNGKEYNGSVSAMNYLLPKGGMHVSAVDSGTINRINNWIKNPWDVEAQAREEARELQTDRKSGDRSYGEGKSRTPAEPDVLLRRIRDARDANGRRTTAGTADTPAPDAKNAYGSQNTLTTDAKLAAAKKSLSAKVRNAHGDPFGGLGTLADVLPELTTIGAYHLEAGLRSFGAWSKQMLQDVPGLSDAHLQTIYANAKAAMAQHVQTGQKKTANFVLADRYASVMGRDGVAKFVNALPADHLDKLLAGAPLSDAEKRAIAAAYRANAKVRTPATPNAIAGQLQKTVRDAKAGRLGFASAKDVVRHELLKDPNADVPRITRALANVKDDDFGALARVYNQHYLRGQSGVNRLVIKANALRQASLLSGPRTLGTILGSHTLGAAMEDTAVRGVAGLIDPLVGRVMGNSDGRSVQGFSPASTGRAVMAGMRSLPEAGQILRHGDTAAQLQGMAPGFHLEDHGGGLSGEPLGFPFNIPGRAHSAVYHVTGRAMEARGIEEGARLKAGRQGGDWHHYVADKDVQDFAKTYRQQQLLQNPNVAASGIDWVARHSGPLGSFAVNQLAPFRKVPFNIVARGLEYGPGGLIAGGARAVAARGGHDLYTGKPIAPVGASAAEAAAARLAHQRHVSTTLARGVVGTGIGVGGYALAKSGALNPPNQKDFENGSVNVGKYKVDVNRLAPTVTPLMFGSEVAAAGKGKADWASPVLDSPYFSLAETANLLKGGDKNGSAGKAMARVVGGALGQAVPTLLSQIAAATDPSGDIRKKQTALDYLYNRVPGLREKLKTSGHPEANNLTSTGLLSVIVPLGVHKKGGEGGSSSGWGGGSSGGGKW